MSLQRFKAWCGRHSIVPPRLIPTNASSDMSQLPVADIPGGSTHSEGLCEHCRRIPWKNLNTVARVERTPKFDHHKTWNALERSAELGCPICRLFSLHFTEAEPKVKPESRMEHSFKIYPDGYSIISICSKDPYRYTSVRVIKNEEEARFVHIFELKEVKRTIYPTLDFIVPVETDDLLGFMPGTYLW